MATVLRFLRYVWAYSVRNINRHAVRTPKNSIKGRIQVKPCQHYEQFYRGRHLVTLALIPTVSAFGFGKKKTEEKNASVQFISDDQLFIKKCDALYDDNRIAELYECLVAHSNTNDDEILWRLARAACEYGKLQGGEAKKEHIYEAYGYIQRALHFNDKNFAVHKWYAILLDLIGEYEGTKQRITNAYKVREHLEKAIELNPHDATTVHSLGFWCFLVADLPWYQQKIASVIFATPPKSSYEEALNYFLEAEKVDPGFYSMNLLMLGKTYLRLNQKDSAKLYLMRVKNYPVRTEDDKRAHKEALELLKSMGIS